MIAGARPTASQLPAIERTVATLVEEGFTPGQAFRGALDWLSAGDFPLLAAALAEVGDPNSEAGFEFGLRLILDGLHAQLARNRRWSTARFPDWGGVGAG